MSVTPLKCVSMNNQECKIRPEIVNVNRYEPVFYLFPIKTSKCIGSCDNIIDPYAKMCVRNVAKNLNAKVFNLMSRTNETRHIKWHETCKCKCRLDVSVCNNKQRRNNDKCSCEYKELIKKGGCNKGFIWNPSKCEYECDKSCDVGAYLDYKNCKCRKRLVDKLVEECSENIDEVKMVAITLSEHGNLCKCSCTIYVVLIAITFIFNIGISVDFVYYKYMNHNKENVSRYDYVYQATNY